MTLSSPIPQRKRFTVQEYHRLVELGFLSEDDHIELIRGELIQMAAKGTAHETCVRRFVRRQLGSLEMPTNLAAQRYRRTATQTRQ